MLVKIYWSNFPFCRARKSSHSLGNLLTSLGSRAPWLRTIALGQWGSSLFVRYW